MTRLVVLFNLAYFHLLAPHFLSNRIVAHPLLMHHNNYNRQGDMQMNILKTMQNHRSIRAYKPDLVPDELLNEILAAGIRASSSGNMQSYSIIVTRDRAIREQLYEPHMEQNMVLDAPVLLTFCADFNRMRQWIRLSNAPDNFDNFMSFMIATIDAVLVSQNVALAAEAQGLGICYLGSTLANCDQIGQILQHRRRKCGCHHNKRGDAFQHFKHFQCCRQRCIWIV